MIVIAWNKPRMGQLFILSKRYPMLKATTKVVKLLIRKHSDSLFET